MDFPGGLRGFENRASLSCVAAMHADAVAKAAQRADRAALSSPVLIGLSSLTSFMAQIVTSCTLVTESPDVSLFCLPKYAIIYRLCLLACAQHKSTLRS